jgi:hypothetical protein
MKVVTVVQNKMNIREYWCELGLNVRFEVFKAVRRIMIWVLVPLGRLAGRCQHFGETYCLHLQP